MSEVAEPMNPYDGFKMLRDHAPVTESKPMALGRWLVMQMCTLLCAIMPPSHRTFRHYHPEERGARVCCLAIRPCIIDCVSW